MEKSLKIASCIPPQLYSFETKYDWVDQQLKQHNPEVMVLSQEFHGGISTVLFPQSTEPIAYKPQEITDPYTELAKKHNCGIFVGGLVDDPDLNERRERTFAIDPDKGVVGFVDKSILPGYDHIDANSQTKVYPEWNLENRSQAFEVCGARFSILYCWEAFSTHIWHAIARAQPDALLTPIKFGICGWPAKKGKNEKGETVFSGFGFGKDGGWLDCLRFRGKWDLACPVICSTNSWELPNKASALCGQILPWDEKEQKGDWPRPARNSTLFNTGSSECENRGGSAKIEEHVQVDQLDFLYWRFVRDHKFTMFEQIGEWPSSEVREQTMRWKVMRMERSFLGIPKLMAATSKKPKASKGKHLQMTESSIF